MKITHVLANNLTIPYPGEVRPAWQPGRVIKSHDFTLVRIYTDEGICGIGGMSGHLAGIIAGQVKPYLIGEDPFATERLARYTGTQEAACGASTWRYGILSARQRGYPCISSGAVIGTK